MRFLGKGLVPGWFSTIINDLLTLLESVVVAFILHLFRRPLKHRGILVDGHAGIGEKFETNGISLFFFP